MTEQRAQVQVHGVEVDGGVLDGDALAAVELAVGAALQSRVDAGAVTAAAAADIAHAVATALARGESP